MWDYPSWKGRWSANSKEWSVVPKEQLPCAGAKDYEKGIFWINMEDFVRLAVQTSLYLNYDFLHNGILFI